MTSNALIAGLRRLQQKWKASLGTDVCLRPELAAATVTLGERHAGWTFAPAHLNAASVIYSFGAGEDISFDCQLVRRWQATVHVFDPTPRSIAWMKKQSLPDGFVFHPYGLAAGDGMRRFHPPARDGDVSHTVVPRGASAKALLLPVRRLETIMRELGHNHIDLLKMDIEGAEYEVIADLLGAGLDVRQLLVEFHHRWPEIGVSMTKRALQELHGAGYRLFSVSSSGSEYGFLLS
jgi:FkbM family methyltransferase